MENTKSNVIVSINTQDIYQHPDNPRKDLGDLSELSDSIAKKGIMQNLTVIPGHWDADRNWHEDGYTLIIGHRRFAAAKQAGIQELPCRVVEDMDKKDQVSTMLEENMQRADLTIWEQANGFQMMLDLGESEEQIAEKSGFTVEEYIRANCEYPGEWDGVIERTETVGNLTVAVVNVYAKDRSVSFHVVSFMRIEEDRICALDEYWGDDGEAPQWRREMNIGVSIR